MLWKFKKLDKNKDSVLTDKEIAGIESLWKEITQDCSIIFKVECDKDKNGNITWAEWTTCLARGGSSQKSTTKKLGIMHKYSCIYINWLLESFTHMQKLCRKARVHHGSYTV